MKTKQLLINKDLLKLKALNKKLKIYLRKGKKSKKEVNVKIKVNV